MSTSTTLGDGRTDRRDRTPAQWYCLLFGATLLLVGLLGFIVDATFDTGSSINGDALLGFEVNGWHNLVHIASGLVLLAAANTAPTAKTVAIAFGVVYGLVALIGLIDGDTVFGLLPVNPADNILHIGISALGIIAGLMSRTFKSERGRGGASPSRGGRNEPGVTTTDAGVGSTATTEGHGAGRFDRNGVGTETGSERTRL
jgi:hypothetical protein